MECGRADHTYAQACAREGKAGMLRECAIGITGQAHSDRQVAKPLCRQQQPARLGSRNVAISLRHGTQGGSPTENRDGGAGNFRTNLTERPVGG